MGGMHTNVRNICQVAVIIGGLLAICLASGFSLAEAPPQNLAGLIKRYDSASCRECHPEIYEQWAGSHHARSMMGLNDFSFMSKYLRKGPLSVKNPQDATLANFSCAKCHLPQLLTTNDKVAKELAEVIWRDDKKIIRQLNIGCLVCHQEKAVVHHKPDLGVIYGGSDRNDHEGVFKNVRKSSFMKSPAFCGQCHGLGPNFEFTPPIQCATLYGSYLHGYVANGGSKTCNDCHMPGKDHSFLPDFSNSADTGKRLKAALPMAMEALPYTFQPGHEKRSPMVAVRVTFQNKAGHRIPDG
jgi:hypothetical protein